MDQRPVNGHLWTEELQNGFYKPKTFKSVSMVEYLNKTVFGQRPSKNIVLTEDLKKVFCGPRTLKDSSMNRIILKYILLTEDLQKVFYWRWTKDLQKILCRPWTFCEPKTFKRPSMDQKDLLSIDNLYCQMTLYHSAIIWRLFTGFLKTGKHSSGKKNTSQKYFYS